MKPYHCSTRFTEMNAEEYVKLMFTPMAIKEVFCKIETEDLEDKPKNQHKQQKICGLSARNLKERGQK